MMATLTNKLSTYGNFQRVRGMLRLLARGVEDVWRVRPRHAHALHLHHLDPGLGAIRQEIMTRLNLSGFEAPIRNDVSVHDGDRRALAQDLDRRHFAGMPPYG